MCNSSLSPFNYQALRQKRLAESTRQFQARGISVVRCEACQLAAYACICGWAPKLKSHCEFILLMHRDEVYKPTNTGRLIGDVMPANTHVFCWHRTEPAPELISLLKDPKRECMIVFPVDAAEKDSKPRTIVDNPSSEKIPTFILLDGTWKQSGRMFHLSRWLDDIACVRLPEPQEKIYAVRQSHQENYVSTLEAAALCLQLINENENADLMRDYFSVFNTHYLATRGSYPPVETEAHARLKINH